MSGIYGDVLLAFPEQLQHVKVYEMRSEINGGFEKVDGSEKSIGCMFQHTRGALLKDNNGNLVKSSGLELWTKEKGLDGFFVTVNDVVCRIAGISDWTREGGFIRYALEKVVGDDGINTEDTTWNIGSNSFG